MIGPAKENQASSRPKTPRWRQVAKMMVGFALVTILICIVVVGAVVFKYERIVRAKPGQPTTKVQPGELGRWVNPFMGTGGFPWVCGHDFPGAMVPFGMVRLSPETASWLLRKRAFNTSGYFYGDDQVLGFSHTRLSGTGAIEGGHFLVVPAIEPVDPKSFGQGRSTSFSHSAWQAA